MSVSTKFQNFCDSIRIPSDVVDNISYRYKRVTKQLNKSYWDTESETSHSLYVGSYGRDTDVHTSDVDILFQLPYSVYERINRHSGNGQSALLSEVRDALKNTYSTTHISGDGQIVKVGFTDGVSFEIVPCFSNTNGSYTYPDTNNGGSWKTTNPKPEIAEVKSLNDTYNGNLKRLCRMTRVWKDYWEVPMGGLLIDTLAYNFLKNWEYRDKSYVFYDWMSRDFFEYLKNQDKDKAYWLALGSGQYVYKKGDFQYKALRCYNIACEATTLEAQEYPNLANAKWREIYGSKF